MDDKPGYKIVFCLQSGNITTGAPKSLYHYLRHTGLNRKNFIVLMPFKGENADDFISDLSDIGIRTEIINKGLNFLPLEKYLRNPLLILNKIFFLSVYICKLILFILREKPQAIYVNGTRGNTESLVGWILACKVLWHVRGLEDLNRCSLTKKSLRIKVKLLRVKLHNLCAKVIMTVSKSEKNVLESILGNRMKNTFVIPNGIEEKFVKRQGEIERSYHSGSRVRVLCLMSTISPNKGIYDVFDAMRLLKAKNFKVTCSIYGRFSTRDDTEDKIKQYCTDLVRDGYIRFFGYTNDTVKVLSENDIFLYPSYFEGFPRAVLEAMASRIVILASGIDGILDQVEDMESALLFQPGDAEEIVNCIEKVVNDETLRKKLVTNAYERVKKNFLIQDISAKIDYVIRASL